MGGFGGGKLELYFGTKNGVLLPIARRGRERGKCWHRAEEVFLFLNLSDVTRTAEKTL